MITHEREDYLKAIYKLQASESPVRTTTLAGTLGVEPGSVTGVIKRLADLKLINYERYKGVTLTKAGEKVALEVIRHHRLIELYLIEALGYSWDEVDAEAEALEHVISERLEERIAALLGDPELDPHGWPIPSREGEVLPHEDVPLSEVSAGQSVVVRRVNDGDPDFLRYLAELDLLPNTRLKVVEVGPFGSPIHVTIGGESHALGPDVASQIFVTVTEAETNR